VRVAVPSIVGVALALAGCTHVIDDAQPRPAPPPVGPIAAGQVSDLLSDKIEAEDGNLFAVVEPEECAGVAREAHAPFIMDHKPAAHDGGHWHESTKGGTVYVEEIVGVYPTEFDPQQALADAQRTLDECRGRPLIITSLDNQTNEMHLDPPVASDSPEILLWSFRRSDWVCENALVAAHNAAIEITTCSARGGHPIEDLADEALDRINKLANNAL